LIVFHQSSHFTLLFCNDIEYYMILIECRCQINLHGQCIIFKLFSKLVSFFSLTSTHCQCKFVLHVHSIIFATLFNKYNTLHVFKRNISYVHKRKTQYIICQYVIRYMCKIIWFFYQKNNNLTLIMYIIKSNFF
jgi:hypothetical protein